MSLQKRLLMLAVFGKLYASEYKNQGYVAQDNILDEVLGTLTPGERLVLERRFDNQKMTLRAIGKIYYGDAGGVTPERIRQIESRALYKLRHPSRARKLWPHHQGPRYRYWNLSKLKREIGV